MKKLFFHLSLIAASLVTAVTSDAQLMINEFSCANRNGITDNYGDREDWIEIYNAGAAPVNLGGYYLSDKPTTPLKWAMPAVNINPGQRIIFFASDRNTIVGTFYHTNFKITQTTMNEVIMLSDASANIIDMVNVTPTQTNHSRGRTTDGAATWSVFLTPTPGAANVNARQNYATRPAMSVAPGFYPGPISVTLSTPDPNVVIRYTINGSEPTAASPVYAGAININATTVVRAKAFSNDPNIPASFIETNTYFINVNHTLPVVSVSSENYPNLFSSAMPEINSALEFFDASKVFQFETYGDVNPHGNDSWAFAQKGIDFITRDQFGYDDEMDYPIFHTSTRPSYKRIMFKAGASDNYPFSWGNGSCHLRDAFIQSLSEKAELEVDERKFESCILYINGQYWGVYEIREKMNDPDFTEYYHDQKEDEIDLLSYWGGLNVRYGSDTGWVNIYNYVMSNSMTVQANYDLAANVIDIQSLIDYTIINTYTVNSDWMNWNTMWWRGRGNPNRKWRYALWDMDNIYDLGHNYSGWPTTDFNADPCDLDAQFTNAGPNEGHLDIFMRMMENDGFKSRYVTRYAELMQTYLSCPFIEAHFDSVIAVLTPEMPGQFARWGGSMAAWQANLQHMRSQILGRCQVIASGIVDCYDVTGPFDVTVIVDPPLSGNVNFSGYNIPSYPWNGSYFGDVTINMAATPNFSWNFWYWELDNHIVAPGTTDDEVSFLLASADTIIAHFRQEDSLTIRYLVDPPLSGFVEVNAFTPAAYPWDDNYISGDIVNLEATPVAGYEFVGWDPVNHGLSPAVTNPIVNFTVVQTDTIIARFRLIDDPVEPEEPEDSTILPPAVWIPNSFTPNNDGINEVFSIVYNDRIKDGTIDIFNRWGEKIFTAGSLDFKWNGTYANEKCPMDVYVYHLRYIDDDSKQFKSMMGQITLIR